MGRKDIKEAIEGLIELNAKCVAKLDVLEARIFILEHSKPQVEWVIRNMRN